MFELKGKKCLVTGGAGFIGSHLTDHLLVKGCRVRVLDNLANGKLDNLADHRNSADFEFVEGSVTSVNDLQKAMKGIEVVFHLACLGVRHSIANPFENHRVNAEGTLLVLEAARTAKVERFLYCSSSEVYGPAEYVPMPENHPTNPCTVYAASKLAGEAYARAYYKTYGMPVTIIRPFNAFGPRSHHEGDAGEMIPKSMVRVLNDKNILVFGNGSQTRDFTYVTDTASGLAGALGNDAMVGQTLNIGSNFEISIKDLAEKIIAMAADSKSKIEFLSDRPGDVSRLFADPNKFMKLSAWRPLIDFDKGLQMTMEYFRNHPAGVASLLGQEKGRNW